MIWYIYYTLALLVVLSFLALIGVNSFLIHNPQSKHLILLLKIKKFSFISFIIFAVSATISLFFCLT